MFGLENVPIFNFSLHLNADVTKCRQFFESFAAVAVLGVGVLVISPLAVSFLANKLQLIYYTDQPKPKNTIHLRLAGLSCKQNNC